MALGSFAPCGVQCLDGVSSGSHSEVSGDATPIAAFKCFIRRMVGLCVEQEEENTGKFFSHLHHSSSHSSGVFYSPKIPHSTNAV